MTEKIKKTFIEGKYLNNQEVIDFLIEKVYKLQVKVEWLE